MSDETFRGVQQVEACECRQVQFRLSVRALHPVGCGLIAGCSVWWLVWALTLLFLSSPGRCLGTGRLELWSLLCWCSPLHSRCVCERPMCLIVYMKPTYYTSDWLHRLLCLHSSNAIRSIDRCSVLLLIRAVCFSLPWTRTTGRGSITLSSGGHYFFMWFFLFSGEASFGTTHFDLNSIT